jgi:hypothetical protein
MSTRSGSSYVGIRTSTVRPGRACRNTGTYTFCVIHRKTAAVAAP